MKHVGRDFTGMLLRPDLDWNRIEQLNCKNSGCSLPKMLFRWKSLLTDSIEPCREIFGTLLTFAPGHVTFPDCTIKNQTFIFYLLPIY